MAALAVHGNSGGWLDSGRMISTLMSQLEAELSDANTVGGQGLHSSWYGLSADAFGADWSRRRSRYEDLIYHAQRAAQAIIAYGQRMADMAVQAARLESTWCSFGLHVLESGAGFMLPPGVESMPPHTQVSFRQALSESGMDVERLVSDGISAAEDLAFALASALAALEDFEFIGVGILANVVKKYVHDEITDPFALIDDALEIVKPSFIGTEEVTAAFASKMGSWLRSGDSAAQSVAGSMLPDAGRAAETARTLSNVVKWGGKITPYGMAAVTIVEVGVGAHHEGLRASLEKNASNITGTAIAVGIAIAAPEAVVGAGPVIAVGLVGAGVGYSVQAIVDHRKAIGHFLESAF